MHQSDTTLNYSHPALFSGRLVALDFVMKYIEDRAVQWTVYIIAFLDRRQQMVHRMSG